ncbi:hypothetical protein BH10PSE13_BH10PSE13_03280 [soil metagenome]
MADATIDDKLRDMARHRGLKLVKSRKRKPGSGDYGKFGLTDASGKPLLGISDEGLTASPDDIETYLRAGATSTWKASADATPARSATAISARAVEGEVVEPARAGAKPPSRDRSHTTEVGEPTPPIRRARRGSLPPAGGTRGEQPKSRPNAEPQLAIRAAKQGDATALLPLLGQLAHVEIDEGAVTAHLEAVRKAGGGLVVAERGALVGCCGWAIIPTIQHGPIGRLIVLLVDRKHRRQGIGTVLLREATTALRKAGCASLEAISDIEIANAHGFFRTLKFEQTSYRFAKTTAVSE